MTRMLPALGRAMAVDHMIEAVLLDLPHPWLPVSSKRRASVRDRRLPKILFDVDLNEVAASVYGDTSDEVLHPLHEDRVAGACRFAAILHLAMKGGWKPEEEDLHELIWRARMAREAIKSGLASRGGRAAAAARNPSALDVIVEQVLNGAKEQDTTAVLARRVVKEAQSLGHDLSDGAARKRIERAREKKSKGA